MSFFMFGDTLAEIELANALVTKPQSKIVTHMANFGSHLNKLAATNLDRNTLLYLGNLVFQDFRNHRLEIEEGYSICIETSLQNVINIRFRKWCSECGLLTDEEEVAYRAKRLEMVSRGKDFIRDKSGHNLI